MQARVLSFGVWALLAASAAYWAMTLSARAPQAPAIARPGAAGVGTGDWARLFVSGQAAPAAAPETGSRFQLLGVVAPGAGRHADEGVALIAVGGELPRAVRLGQVVDGELKLLSVGRREVGLGAGNTVTVRLALPAGAADAAPGLQPVVPVPPPAGAGVPANQAPGLVPPTQVAPQQLPPMPPVTEPTGVPAR